MTLSLHEHYMAALQRDQLFQLRMTAEEKRMLEAIADHEGLSGSDKVRQLVRREYAALFGAPPPKRPKPKK